jgi:hypothetical protein
MNILIFLFGVGLSLWASSNSFPFFFAISIICVSWPIISALGDSDKHETLELKRGKGFFAFLIFSAIVIWGFSSSLYTSEEYAWPEPLNPPENLRIGDTPYFEHSFTLGEIEQAIAVAKELAPEIVTDTKQAVIFAATLLFIYFGLLAFNKQWNQQKVGSFIVICGFLFGGIYIVSRLNEAEGLKYSNQSGEGDYIERTLYPVEYSDCQFSNVTEVESSIGRTNKVENYSIETPFGTSDFSVTSDEKEFSYNPGYTRRTELTSNLFIGGQCDGNFDGWEDTCARFSMCVSAVAYTKSDKTEPYKLLSNSEIKRLLEK